ncbi:MAG: geranylgeranylglycerol-phosphate geranylgeranyltransferase [Desulfurococcaceae archaeon]
MKHRAYIELIRVPNSVLSGVGAIFSILVFSDYQLRPLEIVVGFLTGFLLTSSSMIINDVVDLEVDKMNKPWKPIPRGDVNPGEAKITSLILALIGNTLNTLLGPRALIVALTYTIIGIGYSYTRRHAWSHFLVALSTTGPIVYGYIVAGVNPHDLSFTTLFAATMFTVNLAREFLKAIQDVQGDKTRGYKTIATTIGPEKASIAMLTVGITAVTLALATITLTMSNLYKALIAIAALVYIHSIVKAYRHRADIERLEKYRRRTLGAMFIGIIALLLFKTPL